MAGDAPYKQEFRIRDLTTRSVLLFPTRAQIIRDIKEITLQPGPNQIVVDGLAPTVDEHSIKVEGTGSATISEVTVDLLTNREVFEDIYPSDSEEEEDDDDDESESEDEVMKTITEKIKKLNVQRLEEQEKINSAARRLEICDKFGNSVEKDRPAPKDLETLVKAYEDERIKIYRDHEGATGEVERIDEEIEKCNKEKLKLAKAIVKANMKVQKEKAKLREKMLREKAERYKEKQRIKTERESFWPKKVYRITINLEPSSSTPSSSRRSSVDGDTIVNVATAPTNLATSTFHETPSTPLKTGEISLSLSYITYSASWSPRYDLALNTVKCTGLLEYGASLVNTTSETWANAKIILSTSQTTFSGLSEEIPVLSPWHVRLLKGGRNDNSALLSQSEISAKQREWSQTTGANQSSQKPRWENFGRDDSTRNQFIADQADAQLKKRADVGEKAKKLVMTRSIVQPQTFGSLAYASAAPGSSFGGNARSAPVRHREYSRMAYEGHHAEEKEEDCSDEDMGFGLFDDGTPAPQSLTFEEGAWEESGMTTTYDVPGLKTLAPSNSTTKHKIAKVEFKNIIFSHIVIGKLRQVAFLKARLRNMSKITLLKGPLGLTLDGSFLGRATFPRCSAGETFSLPLGVDPSLTVAYTKPTVRRSQTGIFSKEDNNVYTRMVTLVNTKHNASVECTVLDQVPISEDERLKIEVLNPRGLKVGGEAVRTGSAIASSVGTVKGTAKDVRASVYGTEGLQKDGKWGSAVATAKKGGEVCWNVKLNPGQGVKLMLEYEASFPGGEMVVGV